MAKKQVNQTSAPHSLRGDDYLLPNDLFEIGRKFPDSAIRIFLDLLFHQTKVHRSLDFSVIAVAQESQDAQHDRTQHRCVLLMRITYPGASFSSGRGPN